MEQERTLALLETPFTVSEDIAPQVLYNLPFEEYAAIPAVNSGLLREMDRSPAHGYAYLRNGIAKTEALELGQHIHTRLLEPERFFASYVMMPDFAEGLCDPKTGEPYASPRATKLYKQLVAEFQNKHAPKTCISEADWNTCEGIAARVADHPSVSQFVGGGVKTEVTIVWRDKVTGLPCKIRIDVLNELFATLADFKSTADARPWRFMQSLEKFGYHIQGGHYVDGAQAAGFGIEHYAFIPVEKADPYGVTLLELDPEALEYGRKRVRDLLLLTKQCIETGRWPGYTEEVGKVHFSKWYWERVKGV